MVAPVRILIALCVVSLATLAVGGCKSEGCLAADDDDACVVPSPCEPLAFTCAGGAAFVKRIEAQDPIPGGLHALGTIGDFWLQNDQIALVIDSLDHPHFIAPSGGSILDLATVGDNNDSLNNIFQGTGLLPWDAVHYSSEQIVDLPGRPGVQFRGHLDGRPDITVATRYEIRPCEPGVRVRTEIVNGEADPAVWSVLDGYFWGGRGSIPFTPTPGAGFDQPSFGLSEINDVFVETPYVVATTHTDPAAAYVGVACNFSGLHGVQSDFVSAMGTPRRIVQPRDFEIFERFIGVTDGRSVAPGANLALEIRRQLFGETYTTISGRVQTLDREETFGREERASVTLAAGTLRTPKTERVPWTQIAPAADGTFTARVPAASSNATNGRTYVVEVQAFGKTVAEREVAVTDAPANAGVIDIPRVGEVTLEVTIDGAPDYAQVFFHPTNARTREDTAAKLHGRFAECAPLLGAPNGPSPACNRVLVYGPTSVAVPSGTYDVYATAGPFVSLASRPVQVRSGERASVAIDLQRLAVMPAGWLSGDFHVHGAASEDSVIPNVDRVRAFLAAGIDVIVSSDHDLVFDYSDAMRTLHAADRMVLITGTESTGHILYRWAPGTTTPKVIGHWNFWPLAFDERGAHKGAPWDELAEPGLLMTRMEDQGWPRDTGVAQLNHPLSPSIFGRDLGFPVAFGLDATLPLAEDAPDTPQGVFLRKPDGARFKNSDYDVQEVMNGTSNSNYLAFRAFWFYLLNQGLRYAGSANSDSHGLTDNILGTPRNLVRTTTTRASFDLATFDADVRAGHMIGTNGPVIEISSVDREGATHFPELREFVPADGATLHVRVWAAPWVPVREVRIVVNGEVARTLGEEDLLPPGGPFSTAGIGRLEVNLPLFGKPSADPPVPPLLPASGDAWLIVEAGDPLIPHADLDCDGIPDTSDNNGDGSVDWRDVDRDEDGDGDADDTASGEPPVCDDAVGPLSNPPEPIQITDPAYHFNAVVPGGYPVAFTNPLVFDLDGNGFAGPGL